MQKRRNSNALAMELRLFCIKPSIYAMAWARRDGPLESSGHHVDIIWWGDKPHSSCCSWTVAKDTLSRCMICLMQWISSYLSRLPWIFPGAPLKFTGVPGNIQGNLTTLSLVWGCEHWLTLLRRVSLGLRCDAGYSCYDSAMQWQGCTGQGCDDGITMTS